MATAASRGGAWRKRDRSNAAAMRTGASTRSARPSPTASAAESHVSARISASTSASVRPDLAR